MIMVHCSTNKMVKYPSIKKAHYKIKTWHHNRFFSFFSLPLQKTTSTPHDSHNFSHVIWVVFHKFSHVLFVDCPSPPPSTMWFFFSHDSINSTCSHVLLVVLYFRSDFFSTCMECIFVCPHVIFLHFIYFHVHSWHVGHVVTMTLITYVICVDVTWVRLALGLWLGVDTDMIPTT